MAKYDGLIIPRSYNDYINKSDPAGVAQALQLTGVMDNAPTAQSTKPAKSGGIFAANAVIMADSATLSGVAISAGSVVRVLFTADLTGSDATTGLTLTYNGTDYAVKVGKDGALVALTAHHIEESYIYLQAYTTLELAFDGSQFVVMGNPVVISNADFSIMADGMKRVDSIISNDKNIVTSGAVAREFNTYFRCADVSIQIPERTNAKYLAIANSLPNGSSVYCMGIVQTYATDVGTAYHYDMISNNGNLSLSLNSNTGVLTSIGLEPSTISLLRFSSGLI